MTPTGSNRGNDTRLLTRRGNHEHQQIGRAEGVVYERVAHDEYES